MASAQDNRVLNTESPQANEAVMDSTTYAGGERATLPSETVPPQRTHSIPQQASTSPGDGSEVQDNKIPFAEQAIGYAQITRGTVLRNPGLKEHGEKILEGQASARDPKN